jgi:CheY-specific phosphatase CheX
VSHCPPGLIKLVESAVVDMFGTTGVPGCSPSRPLTVASSADVTEYAASLGFTGEQMKGALVVTCSGQVLTRTNPQREFKPKLDDADLSDWAGEIANQIVGNLKRLVSGYGVVFQLSTPTVVRGQALDVRARDGHSTLAFTLGDDRIVVGLTVNVDPAVTFEGEPTQSAQAAGGDTLLF